MTNTTEPQTATERESVYEIRLTDAEFSELLDVLWFVAKQREKINEDHQEFIADIRTRLKTAKRSTDQTPDAVRAAIATDPSPFEIINRHVQNRGLTERILFDLTKHGFHIALRPVGEGVSKADLRAAVMTAEVAARSWGVVSPRVWESDVFNAFYNLRSLIDRLNIPDAAARAGDGAT